MVKINMISDERNEVTGKFDKIKLNITFGSLMKMYLIGWVLVTGIVALITVAVRLVVTGTVLP